MEDIGARVVGAATLHVRQAGSPYQCLNGMSLNVFSFDGQLFVHNGLQGAQCTYGTWEIAPAVLTSPSQLPVITKAYVSLSPLVGPHPIGYGSVVVAGRGFGPTPGTVALIGYSTTGSGPVVATTPKTWAPGNTVAVPHRALAPGHCYDVVLFTSTGAATTTVVTMPRIVPLAARQ